MKTQLNSVIRDDRLMMIKCDYIPCDGEDYTPVVRVPGVDYAVHERCWEHHLNTSGMRPFTNDREQ